MTTVQEDIQSVFPAFSKESFVNFFYDLWNKIDNAVSITEIFLIIGIFFIANLTQKWIKARYFSSTIEEGHTTWSQRALYTCMSYAAPIIAFVLLLIAMSVTAVFTENLEIYKVAIRLDLIAFLWLLVTRTIPDLFVRWIVSCTLIPFLIFSTFGISAPVFAYLDSLGFPLMGIHFSIFFILKALFVATCLFWGARLLHSTIVSFIDSQKKIDVEIRDLIENLVQVILYTIVVFVTVDILGVDLKSLAIIGGAVGIGIGLGLQKIAANFISGIIILFEQNVKVGHLVEISGGGNPGWIRHLGARATVVDTGDGKELLIPNEELLTKTLIDWTSKNRRIRTNLKIKVSYNSDLEKAKKIILDAVNAHPLNSKILPPSCFLEKFTDNGAQFLLQFWIDDVISNTLNLQNDVLLTVWRRFSEEKIEFPPLILPLETEKA